MNAGFYRSPGIADRPLGPVDVQRYAFGPAHAGFPTFFKAPIALTKEDLIAGDVDVAIVGSSTDNNLVRGAGYGANQLRTILFSAGSHGFYTARGSGKMIREKTGDMEQYMRTQMNEINFVDYGNIMSNAFSIGRSVEEIRAVLGEIFGADAMPLLVGGSHDNLYGIIMAVADKFGHGNFGLVHFDSYVDAKQYGFGAYTHNGNAIYRALQTGILDGKKTVQVGMTSDAPDDPTFDYLVERNVRCHYQAEIEKDGWNTVLERILDDVKDIENLVVSVDVDIMSSAYVPGTGGREVDGITPNEMLKALRALAIQNNVVMLEICEYNPMLDTRSHQTGLVVTAMMRHFLAGLAAKKRGISDPFYYHPKMIDDGK